MKKPSQPTKSNARVVAAQVIFEVLENQAFSNEALSSALERSDLTGPDRRFCTELVYGTLRWYGPLMDALSKVLDRPHKLPKRVLYALLVAAYQLQHLSDSVPVHAAVNEAVKSVKKIAPGLGAVANGALRNLGSAAHLLQTATTDPQVLAKIYGMPTQLVEAVLMGVDESEIESALLALNARPNTYLRVFDEQADVALQPHAFVPGAYSADGIDARKMIDNRDVPVSIQDPASQTAALLMGVQPGQSVLDVCAAPGMKTLILRHQTGPSGRVLAVDQNERKFGRLKENLTRLGLSVELIAADARDLCQRPEYAEAFDAVLLDAPCSGLGTTRRHPEIKYRFVADELAKTVELQEALLMLARKTVKKGGILVYSVCSPLRAEGIDLIRRFLDASPEFIKEDPRKVLPWLPSDAVTPDKDLVFWPHRHDADAFFAARFRKQ